MIKIAFLALFAAVFVTVWFLVPFAWRKREERRLAALCREHRLLVLTYDDGPGTILTLRLLELLTAYEARASFFMLGRNIEARRHVAKAVVSAGHEVGSHTRNHTHAWKANPLRAARDLIAGKRIVDEIGGTGFLFRPPYGKISLSTLFQASIYGLRFGWWTIDSRDSWNRRQAGDVIAEIEQAGGGVVLMHDFDHYVGDHNDSSHAEYVLELTHMALELAVREGLRVVTLSDVRNQLRELGERE